MSDPSKKPDNPNQPGDPKLDDAFNQGSLEERVTFLWHKYSQHILLGIVVIFLSFIGFSGLSWFKARQLDKLQESYRDARDEGNELEFAQANPREPLAGVVFLAQADDAYQNENYDTAIEYYQNSLTSLKNTSIAGRSLLGIAMSHTLNGNADEGKKRLQDLMNNNAILGSLRAEAGYQLSILALQSEDYQRAKDTLEATTKIPSAGIWAQKAIVIKSTTPELKD